MKKTFTAQETFDLVVAAIIRQGIPSVRYNPEKLRNECAYRGENDTKCAAGHLIPDEKYNVKLEGAKCYLPSVDANTQGTRKEEVVTVMTILSEEGHDPKLVRALQVAHDDAAAVHYVNPRKDAEFVKKFREYAAEAAVSESLTMDNINREFPL